MTKKQLISDIKAILDKTRYKSMAFTTEKTGDNQICGVLLTCFHTCYYVSSKYGQRRVTITHPFSSKKTTKGELARVLRQMKICIKKGYYHSL